MVVRARREATAVNHEHLPYRVPPLCEMCCCPVTVTGFGSVVVTRTWPGTFGLPVFFHPACFRDARRLVRDLQALTEGDTDA